MLRLVSSECSAVANNILGAVPGADPLDVSEYRSALIQIISTATTSGAFTFEGSNDGINYQPIPLYNIYTNATNLTFGNINVVPRSSQSYTMPILFHFIRLRITSAIVGGNIRAYSRFFRTPFAPLITQSNGTMLVQGHAGHSNGAAGNAVRVAGRVFTIDTSLASNDTADLSVGIAGQLLVKPYSSSENDWRYSAGSGGILNTTAPVEIRAASIPLVRNYITSFSLMSENLTNATEFVIRNKVANGSVLWRTKILTSGMQETHYNFPVPLRGDLATALEVVTLTASGTGAIYFNAQGYQSV